MNSEKCESSQSSSGLNGKLLELVINTGMYCLISLLVECHDYDKFGIVAHITLTTT